MPPSSLSRTSSAGASKQGRDAIRVLIADERPSIRRRIRRALDAEPEFAVTAEVGDAPAAVSTALGKQPDVCLLEVCIPGGGVAAAWEITARLPATKVVMLTNSRDDRDFFGAIRAGACGYLLKDVDLPRLPELLCQARDGEAPLSGCLTARLVEEFRARGPRRRAMATQFSGQRLTSREWEVFDLLGKGLATAEIARRLSVSQVTIRSHIHGIRGKLALEEGAWIARIRRAAR